MGYGQMAIMKSEYFIFIFAVIILATNTANAVDLTWISLEINLLKIVNLYGKLVWFHRNYVDFIGVIDMNLEVVNNRVDIGDVAKIAFYLEGKVDELGYTKQWW